MGDYLHVEQGNQVLAIGRIPWTILLRLFSYGVFQPRNFDAEERDLQQAIFGSSKSHDQDPDNRHDRPAGFEGHGDFELQVLVGPYRLRSDCFPVPTRRPVPP